MKKTYLLLLTLILLSMIPIQIVNADWSEGSGYYVDQTWETYDHDEWTSYANASVGYFNFTQNIDAFKSWNFTIRLPAYVLEGYWFLSSIKHEVFIKIQNRNNVSEYLLGSLSHTIRLGYWGIPDVSNGWDFPKTEWFESDVNAYEFDVKMIRLTNTVMGVELKAIDPFLALRGYNQNTIYEFSSGFFNNVTISFLVWKNLELGGTGY